MKDTKKNMDISTHTDRDIHELELAGLSGKDSDYGGMVGEAVQELLEVFQKQGHSGHSAQNVAGIFRRLVAGENLTPLKGTPDEWTEVEAGLFQNKRNSEVFATTNTGEGAYYIRGKVFVDKDGSAWTNGDSHTDITFPCFPETKYINREE